MLGSPRRRRYWNPWPSWQEEWFSALRPGEWLGAEPVPSDEELDELLPVRGGSPTPSAASFAQSLQRPHYI